MPHETKISVVTPCFNTGKLIEDLAASLESQTFKHFEWCVADDGSGDETRSILRGLEGSVSFPITIKYFEKCGGNYCRNRAFEASTGQFVKFVDADDVLECDLLEEQFAIAERNPNDLILSPTRVEPIQRSAYVVPLAPELKNDSLRSYLRNPTFMHGGCLLPRKLVDKVGGWDERLQAGQDLDFFRRILFSQPKVRFAGSQFVYRNHNQTQRISRLSNKDHRKFEGHLQALDSFQALLKEEGKLDSYSFELAQNYDVWGMKALALNVPIAKQFLVQAKSLSRDYRSGSRYSKVLRKLFGDRFTSKLIRSSFWRSFHRRMVELGWWPSH